jgi:hypothetical protein
VVVSTLPSGLFRLYAPTEKNSELTLPCISQRITDTKIGPKTVAAIGIRFLMVALTVASPFLEISESTLLLSTSQKVATEIPGSRTVTLCNRASSKILRYQNYSGCPMDADGEQLNLQRPQLRDLARLEVSLNKSGPNLQT